MALNINNNDIKLAPGTTPLQLARQLGAADPSVNVQSLAEDIVARDGTFVGPGGKTFHIFLEADEPSSFTIREAIAGGVAEHNLEQRAKGQ